MLVNSRLTFLNFETGTSLTFPFLLLNTILSSNNSVLPGLIPPTGMDKMLPSDEEIPIFFSFSNFSYYFTKIPCLFKSKNKAPPEINSNDALFLYKPFLCTYYIGFFFISLTSDTKIFGYHIFHSSSWSFSPLPELPPPSSSESLLSDPPPPPSPLKSSSLNP